MSTVNINLNNVQSQRIVVSTNTNAANDRNYVAVATLTFTDPAVPAEGKGFTVYVRNGTSTIGGTAYVSGSVVYRFFHSGSWVNKIVSTGAYNLPNIDGTANQVLQTNGAGTVTWQTVAGGNITIGTTPIASGAVNRILFEGAGNVVQQDSAFGWNNTDKRLILGTEAVADTNSRLVVIGKGTSTNTTFAVHNSTGTNNALVVRDDGFIGFGALPYASSVKYRFNLGTNVNIGFSLVSGTASRIQSLNDGLNQAQTLHINGSTLIFEQASTEYGRIDSSEWRFQNRAFNINRNQVGGGETSILNLNNTGNQSNSTLTQTYNINTTTPYVQLKATTGLLNVSASFYNIFVRNKPSSALVEVMRFTGNGNVTIGGVNDNNDNTTKTLIINNGVAPTSNITDSFQQYSADIVAGNAAPHFRTENGDVVKLYRVGGWGLPTGSFTRTTFDTTTVTLEQLAERVAALIQDLRDNHQLLKA